MLGSFEINLLLIDGDSMFIELTSRKANNPKIVINTNLIISVIDDGVGAVLACIRPSSNQGNVIRLEEVTETYSAVKTTLTA